MSLVKRKNRRRRIERAMKRREHNLKVYTAYFAKLDPKAEEYSIVRHKIAIAFDDIEGCKRNLGT